MSFELVDIRTGKIIERHEYSFTDFVNNKYSRFCSLQTQMGRIIGDVYPELEWREVRPPLIKSSDL